MPPYGGMNSTLLVRLGRLYAAHLGISLSTAGRHVANHGAFFGRLVAGHTITEARTERVARSISHRWPADLAWPPDTPRPTPAPYSPRRTVRRRHDRALDALNQCTRIRCEPDGKIANAAVPPNPSGPSRPDPAVGRLNGNGRTGPPSGRLARTTPATTTPRRRRLPGHDNNPGRQPA